MVPVKKGRHIQNRIMHGKFTEKMANRGVRRNREATREGNIPKVGATLKTKREEVVTMDYDDL
jgi:hypothetical protein